MNGTVYLKPESRRPDDPEPAEGSSSACTAEWEDVPGLPWYCTAIADHVGPHVAYGMDNQVCARWEDPS